MALQKQPLSINFSKGLDTKSDPFQVEPGKFLTLENSIFDKGGLLQKRYGYGMLTSLPDTSSTYTTTFNGNLLALGSSISAFNANNDSWVNRGDITIARLSTLPLIRSSTNQTQVDSATAANGMMCVVFTDNVPSGSITVPSYKYAIVDSVTGQNIVAPTVITTSSGTVSGSPRVFTLGQFFVIVFSTLISGTPHLRYFAISTINPTTLYPEINITSQYIPSASLAFDGVVANNILYLAWNGNDAGGAIRVTKIDSTLNLYSPLVVSGHAATHISVSADNTNVSPQIYVSYYNSGTQDGYVFSVDPTLTLVFGNASIITATAVSNITAAAQNNVCQIIYEVAANYTYDPSVGSHYLATRSVTNFGVVGSASTFVRSVGLASKACILDGNIYMLAAYNSAYQPSYFFINMSGQVVSKLAYSNGQGYSTTGLPSVYVPTTLNAKVAYLVKDQIQATSKEQGTSNPAAVYSQLGINYASFTLSTDITTSSEIGANLNVPTGFLLAYDGYSAVENGFFLYPDYLKVTGSATGGSMLAQQYFYVATYEWTDNQGNLFRSAPSIPLSADLTTLGGSSCSAVINVPTLRLTYKLANPAKIVLYRWSTAQQTYYQIGSVAVPTLNNPAIDYVTITDTQADSSILGNNILYTTGGVIENIAPPACDTLTLFQSRLFLVDAEDKNLIWFSKQILERTPVEMSDLLTIYVAPTIAAQGNTGVITALSAMDDKMIIFKKNAIYYLTGQGPDNTGANSQFSEPTFITSTVGSSYQKSIVLTPNGLMFQSDKGIWLLGRDLNTTYIGAPVQGYTQGAIVQSAVNVPGTNQIRFTLSTGVALMYDYYYDQWGTFTDVPAISSTLYENLHTYINVYGQVFQETPNQYLDGTKPVVMSFTSSWFNMAGLQGFERAYFFTLLGTYISPHKLSLGVAYNYNPSPSQVVVVSPDNFTPAWGGLAQWGSSPNWGGPGSLEQWRVFMQQGKCQSFQITFREIYDNSKGVAAGAGLTLSGLNLVIGLKSGYPRIKASNSIG